MAIPEARIWAAGALLFETHMNRDVSAIQDALAGRDGVIELEDGLVVPGSDGYIRLPRNDDVDNLDQSEGGIIYDTDTDGLRVSNGIEYQAVRTEEINSANIAGVLGTTATTIAEGNHTHG